MNGFNPNQFEGLQMNNIQIVEDLCTPKIPLHDIDIEFGNIIGVHVRRIVQNYEITVRLLRHNNRKCFMSNINAVFQFFAGYEGDTFFRRTFKLEEHLTTCSEPVKNIYLWNVF